MSCCAGICKDKQRPCAEEHFCDSGHLVGSSRYRYLWSERPTDDQVHVHGEVEEIVGGLGVDWFCVVGGGHVVTCGDRSDYLIDMAGPIPSRPQTMTSTRYTVMASAMKHEN